MQWPLVAAVLALLSTLNIQLSTCLAGPLGAAFTYQGKLASGGQAANGLYDLQFTVYDAATGGTGVAGPLTNAAVSVADGLFTTALNFGTNVFLGDARWLDIAVRASGSGSDFTLLTPRQPLTPAPYALYAPLAGGAASATTAGNVVAGAVAASQLNTPATPAPGQVLGYNGTSLVWTNPVNAAPGWLLGGNSGTMPPANFLGTLDNQPLQFKVNGILGWHLDPAPGGVNVVGGNSDFVAATVSAGTVGGGVANQLLDSAAGSTIAGGNQNRIGVNAQVSVIGGGGANAISSNSWYATIGGGQANAVEAAAANGVIAGGMFNVLEDGASASAVVGGAGNRVGANAPYNVIAGGADNRIAATVWYSFLGGGNLNVITNGYAAVLAGGATNLAAGSYATVSGGTANQATGEGAVVAGGERNTATGFESVIGGGQENHAAGWEATVAGGGDNWATADVATVGGGSGNHAGNVAFVGGGVANNASGANAVVAGGDHNDAEGTSSVVGGGTANTNMAANGTIGGGGANFNAAAGGTVSGGLTNSIWGGSDNSTISGGLSNQIISILGFESLSATIGGGLQNEIEDAGGAAIAGGDYNSIHLASSATIGGGSANSVNAGGMQATIGGGNLNSASGHQATVPGGQNNDASGRCSFAAGYRAKAEHDGAFVWADNSEHDFQSLRANVFQVRASGGVNFYSDSDGNYGVKLDPGAGAWTSISDRNAKTNFAPVNGREILEGLTAVPVETWNYKTQDAAIRHIGPMAQDFAAAFQVGADPKGICTVDADGVALAAIQGLNQKLDDRSQRSEDRIQSLETENAELKARLEKLEQLLNSKSGGAQ